MVVVIRDEPLGARSGCREGAEHNGKQQGEYSVVQERGWWNTSSSEGGIQGKQFNPGGSSGERKCRRGHGAHLP